MATTTKAPESSAETEAPRSGRRKQLLVIALPLLAAVIGWYVLLGPASSSEPAAAKEPEPGAVLSLEPITMNLADGRLLKVGLALQVVAEPSSGGHGEVTGAMALDEAIAYLGGRTYAELVQPAARQAAKEELSKRVAERYHSDVLEVYFTEFVMQ